MPPRASKAAALSPVKFVTKGEVVVNYAFVAVGAQSVGRNSARV
jgi:hypothetical protein